jgi:hypothetical protein
VEFFWRPIQRFFEAGGLVYVCVFDAPKYVPVAKAEKQTPSSEPAEVVQFSACDDHSLPLLWQAALADRNARAGICACISTGLQKRFAENAPRFPECAVYTSGLGDVVTRTGAAGSAPSTGHAAATSIGEGDIAVAYWVLAAVHDRSTIVRVLYINIATIYPFCSFGPLSVRAQSRCSSGSSAPDATPVWLTTDMGRCCLRATR